MYKYSKWILRSNLGWLTMSNGYEVNIKVVVLYGIYNFTVNNIFIWDHLECHMYNIRFVNVSLKE